MASKEEVRQWARASYLGADLDDNQKDAIKRTTSQAGLEGERVKRILKGEKE